MVSREQLTRRSGRVKRARRLATRRYRDEAREFLAEGPQAVRGALTIPGVVLEVFATDEATRRYAELAEPEVEWCVVPPDVVAAICSTVHPQGLVARCRFVDTEVSAVLAVRPRLVVVCADIRDPGNAGTVIRCADAVGADAVVFSGHSVDPYNPKAVRASVGSLFDVGIAISDDPGDVIALAGTAGMTVIAADGTADLTLPDAVDRGLLDGPTMWLFGNEAWGLPAPLRCQADHVVAVPIYGHAESLNLASAAAVCLYASAFAHRGRPGRSVSSRPGV